MRDLSTDLRSDLLSPLPSLMAISLEISFLFKLHMIEKEKPKGESGLVGSLRERKVSRSFRHKTKFETLETPKRIGS